MVSSPPCLDPCRPHGMARAQPGGGGRRPKLLPQHPRWQWRSRWLAPTALPTLAPSWWTTRRRRLNLPLPGSPTKGPWGPPRTNTASRRRPRWCFGATGRSRLAPCRCYRATGPAALPRTARAFLGRPTRCRSQWCVTRLGRRWWLLDISGKAGSWSWEHRHSSLTQTPESQTSRRKALWTTCWAGSRAGRTVRWWERQSGGGLSSCFVTSPEHAPR
mmetsp:Transcript_20262/g.60531  ORF Transcript_20262/g.60531 Transcript_20262/m.60531 type:complete len:217 (-) Transcript_20262:2363-3013(-)